MLASGQSGHMSRARPELLQSLVRNAEAHEVSAYSVQIACNSVEMVEVGIGIFDECLSVE